MARYSTLRAASASRKALSHADTSGGDPIAPSASWVASVTMHGIMSIHTEMSDAICAIAASTSVPT